MFKCRHNFLLTLLVLTVFVAIPLTVIGQQTKGTADYSKYEEVKILIDPNEENDSLLCEAGYNHLAQEEWNDAEDLFKRALDLNPQNVKAINGLGLVFFNKGESTFIPIEKIKKLLKIDNFSKAKKQFLLALKYEPEYLDALYNLAMNYLMQEGMANYELSVKYFKETLAKDQYYKDADYMLGIAYRHTGNLFSAEQIFRNLLLTDRSPAKSRISLSEILMETSRPEEGIIFYYRGLERLKDPKMIDDIFAEIEMLFDREEKREFKNTSYSERALLIKKLWKGKDPTPTTPLNERYNVHFERLSLARNNYPTLIPPYFDDRGKIFVKYGEPDNKYVSERYAEMIKPNESWSYENSIGIGMVFDFVREGHSFWEVPTLQDAIHPGAALIYYDLYIERAHLSPTYQRLGISVNESKMIDFKAQKSLAHESAPPEKSIFKIEGKTLQFFYNFARFQGEDGKIKTEIYYGVPRINLNFIDQNIGTKSTLEYTLIFQDSSFTDIKRIKKTIPLRAKDNEDASAGMFLYQENVLLPPGDYRMGIRFENPESDSRNVYRHDLVLEREIPSLSLSDIELASSIEMSDEEGAFMKNGLKVIPIPLSVINKNTPVFTYFEIYNLSLGPSGKSDYTISYKISMVREDMSGLSRTFANIGKLFSGKGKSGISSSYQSSSGKPDSHEFLSFDLSRMKPGIIDLSITVRDNYLEQEVTKTFTMRMVE